MPAHARLRRQRAWARFPAVVGAVCAALCVAACGALPPQAPVAEASIVSTALGTIAASCGEAYRAQEFNPHPDLSGLEKMASQSAARLARISAHHPGWVYQGQTLAQLDALSIQYLEGCSLPRAARVLRRAR